jgi:hypothetical protein
VSALAAFGARLKRLAGRHGAFIFLLPTLALSATLGVLLGREAPSPKDTPTPVITDTAPSALPPRFAAIPPLRAPLAHHPSAGKAAKPKGGEGDGSGSEKGKQNPHSGDGGGSGTTNSKPKPPPSESEKPELTPEQEGSQPVLVPYRKAGK